MILTPKQEEREARMVAEILDACENYDIFVVAFRLMFQGDSMRYMLTSNYPTGGDN